MRVKKSSLKYFSIILVVFLILVTGCSNNGSSTGEDKTIILGDPGHDSIKLHNEIAIFIIENGYDYQTEILSAASAPLLAGFRMGDIDILMETWADNYAEAYDEAIESGDIEAVSVNFDDNAQGFYVPTAMIKGDPDKGIDPVAPDLKHVTDLEKYWELFKDPEYLQKVEFMERHLDG